MFRFQIQLGWQSPIIPDKRLHADAREPVMVNLLRWFIHARYFGFEEHANLSIGLMGLSLSIHFTNPWRAKWLRQT